MFLVALVCLESGMQIKEGYCPSAIPGILRQRRVSVRYFQAETKEM